MMAACIPFPRFLHHLGGRSFLLGPITRDKPAARWLVLSMECSRHLEPPGSGYLPLGIPPGPPLEVAIIQFPGSS